MQGNANFVIDGWVDMTRQQDDAGAAGHNVSLGCDEDDWEKVMPRQLVVLQT